MPTQATRMTSKADLKPEKLYTISKAARALNIRKAVVLQRIKQQSIRLHPVGAKKELMVRGVEIERLRVFARRDTLPQKRAWPHANFRRHMEDNLSSDQIKYVNNLTLSEQQEQLLFVLLGLERSKLQYLETLRPLFERYIDSSVNLKSMVEPDVRSIFDDAARKMSKEEPAQLKKLQDELKLRAIKHIREMQLVG